MPTLADFKKTVSDYLSWEVSQILKKDSPRGSVISQNLAALEREFRSKGGDFREFRLDEVFDISGSKTTPKLKLDEIGAGAYPYVTTQATSNGIAGFYNFWTEKGKCITIDSAVLGSVFYQKENFSASDHVEILRPKFEISENIALYFVTMLNRMARVLDYSYGKKRSQRALKVETILLPTLGGEINFSFMEKFIEELERERVEELDAYLAATGLKDYKLTDKEQAALVEFEEFSQMRSAGGFENVKVGDLFTVKSNPQLNKDSFKFCDNGEYPYFTRTVLNNGIAGYVEYLDDAHKIAGNSLAVGMLGMQFFYMDKDFYAGQFTKTLFAKFDKFSQVAAQYFIVWLNKNQKIYQGGLVRDFKKLLNATEVSIPIKNGEIDYDFITNFLKAIEKLVIKDVVLWAERKITATRQVVEAN